MDSAGNEVIIVDDRAQTNGFNGNYASIEEVSEMKTRSKASGGPGEAAKLRSSSRTNPVPASNVSNSHTKPDERTSTSAAPAPSATPSVAGGAGSTAEKDKKMNLRSGVADPAVESKSVESIVVVTGGKKIETPAAPKSKKGAGSVGGGDREDDSGINSRSSSVSTDDTYSSRLRTRSKRAEAALTSSTPASTRKTSSRMPLSTYDFDDDSILEEDPSTSSSLKRKATKVLVEEMDDDEGAEGGKGEDDDEPPVKVTVLQRTSFFNVLLNPLRAIRGKIFVRQAEKSPATDDAASQTHVTKISDEEPQTEHAASQTDHNEASTATDEDAKEATGTCMVM